MKEKFARCHCGHIGKIPSEANFEKDSIHCPKCGDFIELRTAELVPAGEAKETEGYKTPWHYMRDQLVEKYGDEIGLFLARRIGKAYKKINDPCTDNFGVVELPTRLDHWVNPFFVKAVVDHHKRAEAGCCGRYDETIVHNKTGRKFTFGFNYGH
jgi:hypothetical protein